MVVLLDKVYYLLKELWRGRVILLVMIYLLDDVDVDVDDLVYGPMICPLH